MGLKIVCTLRNIRKPNKVISYISILFLMNLFSCTIAQTDIASKREKLSINDDWKFYKYDSFEDADSLIYDVRPYVRKNWNWGQADDEPTEAKKTESSQKVLKPWILPTGNDFIKDQSKHFSRPKENPGVDFPFTHNDFDDSKWEEISLPHDWAIKGPFFEGSDPEVRGGMGRLPSPGVGWYRKKLNITEADMGKSIFLEVDGAMSYAIVWLNGNLVGGWPFGYNSWRVDLTPYINTEGENQLAIRLDNPNVSSRWYPGGGIYRNVWLVKTEQVHVAQWGTYITTSEVSKKSAKINLEITLDNKSQNDVNVSTVTKIFEVDSDGNQLTLVTEIKTSNKKLEAGKKEKVVGTAIIEDPKLWGPPPTQAPYMYTAVTSVIQDGKVVDDYNTNFGIRLLEFDPNSGVYVNGELIKLQGVNQHHDLGALGAAFNLRAAERQLEILAEMGCNAIRMAHNPPAPELLDLTDKMGFLVVDESFDVWERKKTPHDFHLIFPDWYEQDIRSMIRRDKNHPSVIMWSFGNEVGEQYTDEDGAVLAKKLSDICKDEDPTRPTTAAKNWAKSDMPFPNSMDIISLNYQGQGIRQDPIFEGVNRIRTKPSFGDYHKLHPDKVILSSETASCFSSRGIYYFPVIDDDSYTYTRHGRGGNSETKHVSSYELYSVDFGASPDRVFRSLDTNTYVAGEFVWTGWDHLGEPTPYYESRSSYCGIIDIAGFKKNRFYLYQSRWKPELPMAHILPHWNWLDRVGEITPVHVFTSGDEAELFINGNSVGRKKKGEFEYRFRWDDVRYEPGEVKVVVYKNGEKWANNVIKTTDVPEKLQLSTDRSEIKADGNDLSFITVEVADKNGLIVPNAINLIKFVLEGPGEIIATDNGDPTDFVPFRSKERNLFSGKALAIVRSINNQPGEIIIKVISEELSSAKIVIESNK